MKVIIQTHLSLVFALAVIIRIPLSLMYCDPDLLVTHTSGGDVVCDYHWVCSYFPRVTAITNHKNKQKQEQEQEQGREWEEEVEIEISCLTVVGRDNVGLFEKMSLFIFRTYTLA